MIDNISRGQLVWAWIDGKPKQIKWCGSLPYSGFKYLEPEQDYKEACVYNDDGSLRGWRETKESVYSSNFVETKQELIQDRIKEINRTIHDLEWQKKKLIELE